MFVSKVIASLPSTLEANSLYAVRVGEGFDLYLTDNTATPVAHRLNGQTVTDAYQTGKTTYDTNYIYTSYLSTDGNTYKVRRADRATQAHTYATGTAPVPTDLTILTYV